MELKKFKKIVLEVLTNLSKEPSISLRERQMNKLCLESLGKSMDDKDYDYVEDVCEENGYVFAYKWAIGYAEGFSEGYTNETKKYVPMLRLTGKSD